MKKKMGKEKGLFLVLLLTLSIMSACGGGGDSSSQSALATQRIAGIWIGTFTSNVVSSTFDVTGIIAESGIGRFASTSTGAQYSGVISVNGMGVNGISFSATVNAYAPFGEVFPDGSRVGIVGISGAATPRGAMSGTYSGVGDSGTFSLTYSGLYERPSSLSSVAGTWSGIVSSGDNNTITVDSSGNITGSSTSGCIYSGNVGIIDPFYNAYSVNLSLNNNCGFGSGNYNGFAALTDTSIPNDTLLIEVSNPSFSFVASLRRQ